jgi:hypothetical protein
MNWMNLLMAVIFPAVILLYALGQILAAGSRTRRTGFVLAAVVIGYWIYLFSALSRIH